MAPFVPGGEAIDWGWLTEHWTGCNRFEWLKEHSQEAKERLLENRGPSLEEYTKNDEIFI